MAGESQHYDAIVIGAGYGGVTTAALMAKAGKRVLILEKGTQAGGKAVTVRKAGAAYEMWPIAGGPSEGSRFHALVEELGQNPDDLMVMPEQSGEFLYRDAAGEWLRFGFSSRPSEDPGAAGRMPQALGIDQSDLGGMMQMTASIFSMPEEEIAAHDDTPTLEWLSQFNLPAPLMAYMGVVLNLLFVVPIDRLPVSEAVRTLKDFFRGGGGRYHAGGFGHIAELAVEYVEAHGGALLTSQRVLRILVEDERVVGVATSDGEYRAPVVISNAGLQPTVLKLLTGADLDPNYVEQVRSYEPSWAFVGVRYFLDAPVFEYPMYLAFGDESWWDTERFARAEAGDWPEDPLLFVAVPGLYDASLISDSDHQVALIGTMSSPDPESPMNDAAIAKVEEMTARLWPEITKHTIRKEIYNAHSVSAASRDAVVPGQGGECIGLAQIIGQCGASKPDIRGPIPGLYYAGCDAGGYGCGTHQAVESGFVVAEAVLADMSSG